MRIVLFILLTLTFAFYVVALQERTAIEILDEQSLWWAREPSKNNLILAGIWMLELGAAFAIVVFVVMKRCSIAKDQVQEALVLEDMRDIDTKDIINGFKVVAVAFVSTWLLIWTGGHALIRITEHHW